MTDYIIYRCILDYMLLLFGLWALASVITSAIFAEAKRSIDERRSGMYDRASDRNILGRCGGRDMPIHYRRVHRECPREVKCRAGQAPKQRQRKNDTILRDEGGNVK